MEALAKSSCADEEGKEGKFDGVGRKGDPYADDGVGEEGREEIITEVERSTVGTSEVFCCRFSVSFLSCLAEARI